MISVIIPVYNVSQYLLKCLESLEKQTLGDIEFIIVNDGSTDGSDVICQKFISGKPKFTFYSKENGGLMSAWMFGVQKAKGDYLGFVDSDDYIDETMFETLYSIAEKQDCDIVMCDRYDVNDKVVTTSSTPIEPGLYTRKNIHVIYENILPKFNGWHITNARWNKIFRKDLFMNNIKYCKDLSRICEDRFIVPSCVFGAKSFYYLNMPLYYYVQRVGSNHSMYSKNLYNATQNIYKQQCQMLKDKGLDNIYGTYLERANLNYLRLNISRNLLIKTSLRDKIWISRQLVDDKNYRREVKQYPYDLTGKMGCLIKITYKLRCPLILALFCHFGS